MKKLLLIIAVVLFTLPSFGQLSEQSEVIQEKLPLVYNILKQHAIEKWDSDHTMIVYQINKQSEAIFEFFEVLKMMGDSNSELFIVRDTLKQWSYEGYKADTAELLKIEGSIWLMCHVDWVMVVHQVKEQLKASKSY